MLRISMYIIIRKGIIRWKNVISIIYVNTCLDCYFFSTTLTAHLAHAAHWLDKWETWASPNKYLRCLRNLSIDRIDNIDSVDKTYEVLSYYSLLNLE